MTRIIRGLDLQSRGGAKNEDRMALRHFASTRIRLFPLAMWIVVGAVAFATPGTLSRVGILGLTNSVGPLLLIGIGLAGAVVAGCIDLSIVQIGEAASLATAISLSHGASATLSICIGLGMGICLGIINGAVVSYLHVSSLMTTLATSLVLSGAELMYMNGPQAVLIGGLGTPGADAFNSLGRRAIGPIALLFIVSAAASVAAWVILDRTLIGRRVVLVGQSAEASWYAGIDPRRSAMVALAWSGFFGAAGGIAFIAQSGIAVPGGIRDFLVPVFAGVLVGAVIGRGRRVTVATTLFGISFVVVLGNALTVFGLSAWVTDVVEGGIIVGIFGVLSAAQTLVQRGQSRTTVGHATVPEADGDPNGIPDIER
jgi:ribose transport system permease protein